MARTPTAADIPLPQIGGARPVAAYDVSAFGAGGQALARGTERLGAGIEHGASEIAAKLTEQQRQTVENAKTGLATDLINLRSTYENSNDINVKQQWDTQAQAVRDKWRAAAPPPDTPLGKHFDATSGELLANESLLSSKHQRRVLSDAAMADITRSTNDAVASVKYDPSGAPDATADTVVQGLHAKIDGYADKDLIPSEHAEILKQHAGRQIAEAHLRSQINSGPDGAQAVIYGMGGTPRSRDYTSRLFHIESGGNPNAVTGSNRGLGQFGPYEESKYGINDQNRTDPAAQARAVRMERAENAAPLARATGRNPTDADFYLAHQQGQAGATALLSNPSAPAWQAIRRYYGSDRIAKQAIEGNIPNGSPLKGVPVDQISAQAFTSMWKDKFETGSYGNYSQMTTGTGSAGTAPRLRSSDDFFSRNTQAGYVAPGAQNYTTDLGDQEPAFRKWVADNKVPFDPAAKGPQDYDMRGFYKALQAGDPRAQSAIDPNDQRLHYPDYWKTPYHETFSNESQWASKDAPKWNDKDQLVDKSSKVVFDDRAQGAPGGAQGNHPLSALLTPQQQDALIRHAQVALNAHEIDQQRLTAASEKARKDASQQFYAKVFAASNLDPTQFPLTPAQIIGMGPAGTNQIDQTTVEKSLELYKANIKVAQREDHDTKEFGPAYWMLLQRIHPQDGHLKPITSPSEVYDAYTELGPAGELTATGAKRLTEILKEGHESEDKESINRAKVGLLKSAEDKMAKMEDIGFGPVARNPVGRDLFNSVFVPRFEAEYSNWIKNPSHNPWEFLQKKNLDALIDQVYPHAKRDADFISATGGASNRPPEAANLPLPPAPERIDPKAWNDIVGAPPATTSGAGRHDDWAKVLNTLLENPSPQVMAAFDSKFAPAGLTAMNVLRKLDPAAAIAAEKTGNIGLEEPHELTLTGLITGGAAAKPSPTSLLRSAPATNAATSDAPAAAPAPAPTPAPPEPPAGEAPAARRARYDAEAEAEMRRSETESATQRQEGAVAREAATDAAQRGAEQRRGRPHLVAAQTAAQTERDRRQHQSYVEDLARQEALLTDNIKSWRTAQERRDASPSDRERAARKADKLQAELSAIRAEREKLSPK